MNESAANLCCRVYDFFASILTFSRLMTECFSRFIPDDDDDDDDDDDVAHVWMRWQLLIRCQVNVCHIIVPSHLVVLKYSIVLLGA